jgi:hypothetical protein
MFEALLAYDCRANPNHRVKGPLHALWDCLWQAGTCGAVDQCVFPGGKPRCGSASGATYCGAASVDGGTNADVRLGCPGPGQPANGENCALWGQRCAMTAGGPAVCSGGSAADCTSGCFGARRTELHWCTDAGDLGLDCSGNGAQLCVGIPPDASVASWVACAAESDAGTCTPDAAVACANGVAFSCPSGVPEQIDCDDILGVEGGCVAGVPKLRFDWPGACAVASSTCADSCTGSGLTGCAHGAAFTLEDCNLEHLGPCHVVPTLDGPASACAPPP